MKRLPLNDRLEKRTELSCTGSSHVYCSLAERMRPGVWGPFISGPQRELLPRQKHISLLSPALYALTFLTSIASLRTSQSFQASDDHSKDEQFQFSSRFNSSQHFRELASAARERASLNSCASGLCRESLHSGGRYSPSRTADARQYSLWRQ